MNAKYLSGITCVVMLLIGCASGPMPPDWQMSAQGSTERAVDAYLTGRKQIDELEFAKARNEVSRTGSVDLAARVELIRCAVRVASLEMGDCDAFGRLSQDVGSSERAYAEYLGGRSKPENAQLLPPAHRNVVAGGLPALQSIKEPLSRLVAAGVLFRLGLASPTVVGDAVDTASAQGWSRPLLAWLGVQIKLADAAGDSIEADRLRRRANIVLQQN